MFRNKETQYCFGEENNKKESMQTGELILNTESLAKILLFKFPDGIDYRKLMENDAGKYVFGCNCFSLVGQSCLVLLRDVEVCSFFLKKFSKNNCNFRPASHDLWTMEYPRFATGVIFLYY